MKASRNMYVDLGLCSAWCGAKPCHLLLETAKGERGYHHVSLSERCFQWRIFMFKTLYKQREKPRRIHIKKCLNCLKSLMQSDGINPIPAILSPITAIQTITV